jgi:hypothetical protein
MDVKIKIYLLFWWLKKIWNYKLVIIFL